MENCEQPIVERYEKLHAEYSSLIQKTKQDFQSEAFSENLTDIYLFQHQTNTGLVNMIKQMKLPEKIETLTNKGEQALKQFQELKGAYENKEKSSKGNLESIIKELNEQHNKHIEQMEAQKKEIDNDFKEKLKSLSKNYS